MPDTLVPLLLLMLAFYLWQAAMRARETARSLGQALCQRAGVQLLDETVALQRFKLVRSTDGWLQLQRRYRFEVSTDGADRHFGSLDIAGDRVIAFTLPTTITDAADIAAAEPMPPRLY